MALPPSRPVTSAAPRTSAVTSHAVPASAPAAIGKLVAPQIRLPRERVLLCGDSFCGKSYAYMRLAETLRTVNFHVIDTNDTMPKFVHPDVGEFSHLAFNVPSGNVYPYPCFGWNDIVNAWASIKRTAKPGDYVVVDLVSQMYNYAQQYVAEARGKVLTEEAYQRALANKGFGAFDAPDWMLVKTINESTLNEMMNDPRLNFIGVSHVADIVDVEGRNKREVLLLFDQIGLKPQVPDLAYKQPDTVIMLWANRYIDRDDRGRRRPGAASARTVRNMAVLKDRGIPVYEKVVYDTDCFAKLNAIRSEMLFEKDNIRNATTAAEIAEVMAHQGALAPTDAEPETEAAE